MVTGAPRGARRRRDDRLGRRRLLAVCLASTAALGLAACGDREVAVPGPLGIRGTIEGFYGRPYTTDERERLIRFMGARGMNAYVYAPKSDPKHRDQWREPYSAAELADFARIAAVGRESGVRVYFAISPGITFDPSDAADLPRLEDKLASVHRTGVDGFALLLDDIFTPSAPALDPGVQARLVARTGEIVRSFGADVDYWFIGNLYAGTADEYRAGTIDRRLFLYAEPPVAYFDAYDALVPREVPILWTGPRVISPALRTEVARAVRELVRRPLIAWDNYPANDVFQDDLFLGPYLGRDANLGEALDGIVCNLMTQPTAGLLAVATAADFMRDPGGYDPERSWHAAIADLGGDAADALELFAEQHRGHPFLAGAAEAPELGRLIEATFPDGGRATGARGEAASAASERPLGEARGDLRTYLGRLEGNLMDLGLRLDDRTLLHEIDPWAFKLFLLARAGLLGLDALDASAAPDDYRVARDQALAGPQSVARDDASELIESLAGAQAHRVDRFGDLFAAIDARLAAR
jgi:beta-N-acetylglucosaminidase